MRLKHLSEKTVEYGGRGTHSVAKVIFSKNGGISLNRAAISKMKLKDGDRLTLSNDEDDPENWYLHNDPENGFKFRLNSSGQFIVHHTNLVKEFKKLAGLDDNKTYRFLIAGIPTVVAKTKYWGILIIK